MATVAFSGVNVYKDGYQAVTCGDSATNVYTVTWTVTLQDCSRIGVLCQASGATDKAISCSTSGTYNCNLTTLSATPVITITFRNWLPLDAVFGYITPINVTYPISTSPNTPTINSVSNVIPNGDTKLSVALSPYVDAGGNAVSNRITECYKSTGDYYSVVNTTGNTVGFSGLLDYTAFKFRAKDKNILGFESGWSDWSSNKTTYSTPATPVGTYATITSTTAVLNTSAFSNADGAAHQSTQWVIAKALDNSIYSNVVDTTNKVTKTFTLVANTDYYFKARHISSEGVSSAYSSDKSFSTYEASSKKIAFGVALSQTITRQIAFGVMLVNQLNTKALTFGIVIANRVTAQIAFGIKLINDGWTEDTLPASSWSEV